MADFSTLIASIEATIKQNGVQAITGQVLQDELLAMVAAINQLKQDTLEGYAFYGEALPNGATRVVTQNTFFLAGAGSYTINGNAVTIADNGISVIVYDCVNDEISTYQLFAYDANPTSGSANAVTSGGVKSALDTKADKNGASPDLFAGFAGNLVDTRSAGTRQSFAFRQSGGDGVNYMRKILGRTEAFNQLVTDPIFSSTSAWTPSSGSLSVSNNIATFTKDSTTASAIVETPCPFINGHTYYVKARVKTSVNALVRLSIAGGSGSGWDVQKELISGTWTTINGLISSAHGPYSVLYITTNSLAENDTMQIKEVRVSDLTLEYGAGNEPATPEAFEALHPLPYYNYNAGVLKNNAATRLETVGFNQWDEEWEDGVYWQSTGQPAYEENRIRGKNYIPVFGNTTYYAKCPVQLVILSYDADKNYLGETMVIAVTNDEFLTPAGAAFIRFYTGSNLTTYNHDICINRSDASRNGTYEPYWKRDIVLGLDNLACHDENNNAVVVNGLDGVGSSYDEAVVENGMVTKINKKMAEVDLGSLGWTRHNATTYYAFLPSAAMGPSSGQSNPNSICTQYTIEDVVGVYGGITRGYVIGALYVGPDPRVMICDPAFENYTEAQVAAALSSVKLRFELATPKVLTLDNPIPALIEVDNLGTEKRLPEDTADNPQAPFECDSNYSISTANLVRKLSE